MGTVWTYLLFRDTMKNVISYLSAVLSKSPRKSEVVEYESEKLLGRPSFNSSTDQIDIERITTRPKRRLHVLNWIWRVMISGLVLWALINVSLKTWPFFHRSSSATHTTGKVSCSCGNSIAEAKSLRCKFDALASAWVRIATFADIRA